MKIVAKPIDAIVRFHRGERPEPYRFRYVDTDGEARVVKIDQILFIEDRRVAGIRTYLYRCQSIVDGQLRLYELKYIIPDCRWELYKI